MSEMLRRPVDPWNESTITAAEEARVRDLAQMLELRGQSGQSQGAERKRTHTHAGPTEEVSAAHRLAGEGVHSLLFST